MQYRHLQMPRISFVVVGKTLYQNKAYSDFWDSAKTKQQSNLKRSSRIRLLLFILLFNFCHLYEEGKFNIVSMFHFLETDIREQRKYEIRTQTSADNTVSNRYEIKFENCVKHKNNIFVKRNIAFLSWTKICFILGDILF